MSMLTATLPPSEIREPEINRRAWTLFAEVFAEVYLIASEETREAIELNSKIVRDHAAGKDERNAALDRLVDVLLPSRRPEQLGRE